LRHRRQNAERLRKTIRHHLPAHTPVAYQELTSGLSTPASTSPLPTAGTSTETGGISRLALSVGQTSPTQGQSDSALKDTIKQAASQLAQWRTSNQAQQQLLAQNTTALQQNTSAQSSTSKAGGLLKSASGFLSGGLGSIPLLSSIFSLLGGSSASTQTPLKFDITPPQLQFEQGIGSAGSTAPVYDQFGTPRVAAQQTQNTPTTAPSITVNVHAMDSRSFMDHSFEIAQAVKDAMLNLHSINDVVNEL
jgi:hypothetical protein